MAKALEIEEIYKLDQEKIENILFQYELAISNNAFPSAACEYASQVENIPLCYVQQLAIEYDIDNKLRHSKAHEYGRDVSFYLMVSNSLSLLKLHNVIILLPLFSKTSTPILMKLCM